MHQSKYAGLTQTHCAFIPLKYIRMFEERTVIVRPHCSNVNIGETFALRADGLAPDYSST